MIRFWGDWDYSWQCLNVKLICKISILLNIACTLPLNEMNNALKLLDKMTEVKFYKELIL